MKIVTIIENEIKKILSENKDRDIGISLNGLIGDTNGFYKSDAQKTFLLKNITSPSEKTHTYCETFYFGAHGGASAKACYRYELDDKGVISKHKWTQKQGDRLEWKRTEEMEREADKKFAYWEFQKNLRKEVDDKKQEYYAFKEKTINELNKLDKTKEDFEEYLNKYGLRMVGFFEGYTDNTDELLEQIRKTEEIVNQIPSLQKGVDAMKIVYNFINSEIYQMYEKYYQHNISPKYHELNRELKPEYKKIFS